MTGRPTRSGHVAIVVFDDRVEIRSIGGLPAGVTVGQLSRTHRSRLRNPLIAEAFHRTGAVEVWGRGTNRVIAECLAHGALPPLFEEDNGWVIVTFRAAVVQADAGEVTEKTRGESDGRNDGRSDGRSDGDLTEKTPSRILEMLTVRPNATIPDLAKVIGVSISTIERNIRMLQEQNRLRRIGSTKGGRWEVLP